jgi:hypothetical protein
MNPKYDCHKATQLHWQGGTRPVRCPSTTHAHRVLPTQAEKIRRPYDLHNKDIIVRCTFVSSFPKFPKVVIDDYRSVCDWYREASREHYWEQLVGVGCLLALRLPIPTRPTNWPAPRQHSPQNHTSEAQNQELGESNQCPNSNDSPPIPSPPVSIRPRATPTARPRYHQVWCTPMWDTK